MEIAMDPSGTHALQSLIEIININKNEDVIKEILDDENIIKLSFNCNGTHILQKIITVFDEENRTLINKCILENFLNLCMDANGICVVIILSLKNLYKFKIKFFR